MTMIGAAIPVFFCSAAEFAHGNDNYVAHAIAQVLMEGRERLAEITEKVRELTLRAAFVDVIVSPTTIDK